MNTESVTVFFEKRNDSLYAAGYYSDADGNNTLWRYAEPVTGEFSVKVENVILDFFSVDGERRIAVTELGSTGRPKPSTRKSRKWANGKNGSFFATFPIVTPVQDESELPF